MARADARADRAPSHEEAAPRGKAAVQRALVDAAAELFADHGPESVSVRDIAERAGVNHGLVHRHFGSKEGLLRAVLDDLSSKIWQGTMGRPREPGGLAADAPHALRWALEATLAQPLYFRVLARALLDGHRPRDVQSAYPVVRDLVGALEAAQHRGEIDPAVDAPMAVALLVSTALGWLVFEPYLLAATGQDDLGADCVRERLSATWQHVISSGVTR